MNNLNQHAAVKTWAGICGFDVEEGFYEIDSWGERDDCYFNIEDACEKVEYIKAYAEKVLDEYITDEEAMRVRILIDEIVLSNEQSGSYRYYKEQDLIQFLTA